MVERKNQTLLILPEGEEEIIHRNRFFTWLGRSDE